MNQDYLPLSLNKERIKRSSKIPCALKNQFLMALVSEDITIKDVPILSNIGCPQIQHQLLHGQGHCERKQEVPSGKVYEIRRWICAWNQYSGTQIQRRELHQGAYLQLSID